MNKIYKNKKIIFGVIALSLLVYFVFSDFVSAQEFTSGGLPTAAEQLPRGAGAAGAGGIAKAVGGAGLAFLGKIGQAASWGLAIFGLLQVLYHVLFWFVTFAYALLNSAVAMALNPYWFKLEAVLNAWRLVRDFVNVWFILIFLFIAIATILRVTNYQAKKLLPTIVLVALVVNFSMPVSKFVIDLANIVAFQFLKAICVEKVEPKSGIKSCDVSASLENALDAKIFTQALQELPEKQGTTPQNPQENNTNKPGAFIPSAHAVLGVDDLVIIVSAAAGAISLLTAGWGAIQTYLGNSSVLGIATKQFVGILVSDIFLAVTAYVILSLAILFLIRIITLLFIVIISPLGFVMSALPGTQNYGKMWWNKLLTQSFFAPISLFFLWISIALMGSLKLSLEAVNNPALTDYDLSSPVSIRLIFYIFSLILLYASLWIARKMGAIGASTLMKWADTAKGAVTGFVGGLASGFMGGAARKVVAPIGASMTAAGLPEAVGKRWWLGGALGGVKARDFAEYLSKRGKAPEDASAKAELGMRLAPADRGAYFAKLDRAAKEAMLRKMKGEERNSFMSDLATKDLASAQEARTILRSGTFAPEERAKTEMEEFKYTYTLPEQWKKFGSLSADLQKQLLLGIDDAEKRAQFLDHVRDEAEKANSDIGRAAFENANTFLETSSNFSANQQYANKLARGKVELSEAQKANNLVSFFEGIADAKEQKSLFRFAMNDAQRLEIMEAWKGPENAENLKLLQGWINEMEPTDQDKFYRDTIGKRATADAVVAFINSVDTKKPERDSAIKKMILSATSAEQLARVAQASPNIIPTTDEIAESGTMSERNRQTYYRNQGRTPPRRPSGPGGGTPPPTTTGPAPVAPININTSAPIDVAKYINNLDYGSKEIQQAFDNLTKETNERQKEIVIHLNPLFKVSYVDIISPSNITAFEEALARDIKKMARPDLDDQIFENPSVTQNGMFLRAILRGSDTPKLVSLMHNYPEIKQFVKEQLNRDVTSKDPELHAQAIADMLETEFENEELATTLSDIRRNPKESLSPIGRNLKKDLFGE